MASWALGASQNALTTRSAADFRRAFLMVLKMVQYQDAADMNTRVSSTIHETANSPGLATISDRRWSKPIWVRAEPLLPPAAAAMKISCSITLTFCYE